MKNKIVLILIVLAVAAGGFFLWQRSGKSVTSQVMDAVQKGTIQSLLGSGKNVTCDISNPDGSKGTIFVSGNKLRANFSAVSGGTNRDSSFIRDENYTYMWSGSKGTKLKNQDETAPENQKQDTNDEDKAAPPGAGQITDSSQAEFNREVEMDCRNWTPDQGTFTPPEDVEFTDLSAMMDNSQKTGDGMMDTQKQMIDPSVCDQMPDAETKAKCLEGLPGNQ